MGRFRINAVRTVSGFPPSPGWSSTRFSGSNISSWIRLLSNDILPFQHLYSSTDILKCKPELSAGIPRDLNHIGRFAVVKQKFREIMIDASHFSSLRERWRERPPQFRVREPDLLAPAKNDRISAGFVVAIGGDAVATLHEFLNIA
jgi:hypothetical protein